MAESHTDQVRKVLTGLMVGTAVGDSIGLPREGLSPRRAKKIFGDAPLKQKLIFRLGLCSDDTEHAIMCAEALLVSRGDPERFAAALAARLRWWLAGLPAGTGFATLRAILKLWFGVPPACSGVFSAGNGPAMRAPMIGSYAAGDRAKIRALNRASTILTHSDPKAEQGALAIALAAEHSTLRQRDPDVSELFNIFHFELSDAELLNILKKVKTLLDESATLEKFQETMGFSRGVSGYMYHTVPAVLFCWLRSPKDFRTVIENVVLLGGDSDTTGSIAGALAGANLGIEAIPAEWHDNLLEWTTREPQLNKLLSDLSQLIGGNEVSEWREHLVGPRRIPRNLFFATVVICHGFRRLLPPY